MDRSTKRVYETRAAEWAERRPPSYRERAAAFSHRCLPGRPRVDLGCGPGSYFPDLGRPLVGLEGARAMLVLAKHAAPDVFLVQADLDALPFASGCTGGAWARASYLHLPRTALPAALAQLHATLALGAPLEMSLKAGTDEGLIADDDFPGRFFAHWEADPLIDVVGGAGFALDELIEDGDWLVVRATRARTLPDFVGPGMRILVCGLNPSVVAADAGFGYAGATNRFWPAAAAAELITTPRRPLQNLVHDGVGMTDLVKRATPRASEVSEEEYRAGAIRVTRLVEWLRPRLTLFVGLTGWRAAVNRRASAGLQSDLFGGRPAYVMPSTSGLNARTSMADLVGHLTAALACTR
ncbi:MAG TPA: uracil-DNA glycosylase family protein [Acidimicrobiales bacterium]|nr:uracil-DNA glycosylase family protein [Acidimicrobiales bacterium]